MTLPRPLDTIWRNLGVIGVHVGCLMVLWTGISPAAVGLWIFAHYARAFGLTAGFHRLFAHRAFKTSRTFRFLLALLGTAAAQQGPMWWAGLHVNHHRFADREGDVHSPVLRGFWWSHMGWKLSGQFEAGNPKAMREFAAYPEIRFLDEWFRVIPLVWAALMFGFGFWAERSLPGLGLTAGQALAFGFFVPTTTLYHATFSVNSICHLFGYRNFETGDHSRNNPLVAFFTLGEGWHNNHHAHPTAARQGLRTFEVDPAYLLLLLCRRLGLIWDMRPHPALEAIRSGRPVKGPDQAA